MTKTLSLKALLTIWLLALLAGCNTSNRQAPPDNIVSMAEVASFYDGSISASEKIDDSVKAAIHYIQIDLHSPNLKQRYGTHLELPASVCAYAVWHQLSPTKQAQISFFKVTLHSLGNVLTYKILANYLSLAASASIHLAALVSNLKHHNIAAIANSFTTESLRAYSTDSLQPRLAQVANKLHSIPRYDLEGFTMLDDTSAQRRPPLVSFLVSIPQSPSQSSYLLSASFVSGTNKNTGFINDMHLTK